MTLGHASYLLLYLFIMFMHHVVEHCMLIDFVPLLHCCVWLEPGDDTEYEVSTEVECEEQGYDPSVESTGKMTIPRYHYYLCLC